MDLCSPSVGCYHVDTVYYPDATADPFLRSSDQRTTSALQIQGKLTELCQNTETNGVSTIIAGEQGFLLSGSVLTKPLLFLLCRP